MLVTPRDLAVVRRPFSRGYREIKENWTCWNHKVGVMSQLCFRFATAKTTRCGRSHTDRKDPPTLRRTSCCALAGKHECNFYVRVCNIALRIINSCDSTSPSNRSGGSSSGNINHQATTATALLFLRPPWHP